MKKMSRIKKNRRKELLKSITSIIALICLAGLVIFCPFVWWFFEKELFAITTSFILIGIFFTDVFVINFIKYLERR